MEKIVTQIEHLKKSFGRTVVLEDVNLTLAAGENLVVLGRSGTGKSVLIKCLIGLMEPDEGKITLLGEDIANMDVHAMNIVRKRVGFLFQSAALYDSMTVRENLEFPLRDRKDTTKEQIETMVLDALQHVWLSAAIDKMPSELSGGMRKRVGLARALMLNPEIILYDEPTTGLDPITSREISHLILAVQQQFKSAAIIITHDIDCARITANRVLILKEGRCYAEGTFQELSTSKDEWVSTFFRESQSI